MITQELFQNIIKKRSFLCIGLDTDINKLPKHLLKCDNPVFEFNKKIINATHDLCVAYKLNTAFYEVLGEKGWRSLEKTIDYLTFIDNSLFKIADAKRGDIANTARLYAQAFLDKLHFDAITVNPYMGKDSVTPYLEYKDKCAIVLALTSNKSSEDFQFLKQDKKTLFIRVIEKAQQWATPDNLLFVVGATHANQLKKIRSIAPDNFLLIPGIGAQGGDMDEVVKYGINDNCGLLINSSRNIIYAGQDKDFAQKARKQAMKIQKKMEQYLKSNNII